MFAQSLRLVPASNSDNELSFNALFRKGFWLPDDRSIRRGSRSFLGICVDDLKTRTNGR